MDVRSATRFLNITRADPRDVARFEVGTKPVVFWALSDGPQGQRIVGLVHDGDELKPADEMSFFRRYDRE